jgi:chemotaxis protein CheY-P-specific phosphatase CheC
MDMRSRENNLTQIMNSGFERAADSFSKMVNRSIKITNSKSMLVVNNKASLPEEKGMLYILTTRVIGDLYGKSFLIFSEEEYQEIVCSMSTSIVSEALNEAFLIEIDNVISAPVIAELSRSLDLEVYGDVPQLTKINANGLNSFILGEMVKEEPDCIITNTTLQFEQKKIHPQFIWKWSSKILQIIPDQMVVR